MIRAVAVLSLLVLLVLVLYVPSAHPPERFLAQLRAEHEAAAAYWGAEGSATLVNSQGQVFEMYAKQIYQSDLWGFLEVEEFVFGERTQLVVDPGEEKLKAQFEGVVRSFVPMHSIVRIDEVERLGTPKISEARGAVGNVMPFPMPMPEK